MRCVLYANLSLPGQEGKEVDQEAGMQQLHFILILYDI